VAARAVPDREVRGPVLRPASHRRSTRARRGLRTTRPSRRTTTRPPTRRFGIEAQKLLDELRSHDVPFTDADANILVDIGDRNIARNIPDLSADDPVIADQVAKAFPRYTDQ
jgi:hypothetical protein